MHSHLPLLEWLARLSQHPDQKERLAFFEEELKSITGLRTAHAHGVGNFDVVQIQELLVDASAAANVLEMREVSGRIAENQPLLEDYHREATSARVNFHRQVTIELHELAANSKRLQEELEQEETRVSEHLQQLQSRKIAWQQDFDQRKL